MELIGQVEERKIYYLPIRNNPTWKKIMPKGNWVAFTIANKEDKELVKLVVEECLNRNVSYTCSAGNYAYMTEELFDEEITWRGVEYEMKTKEKFDYEYSPVITAHKNFGEGFWFAARLASDDNFDINKVVCIDFTKRKVENHLIDLIKKINKGWLPSDNAIEMAEYDEDEES
jgi:hypothetical protein